MVEERKDNTEEKILEAARKVFIKKGMDGARMQEIANEAGINKALLHYYFRSKQKLFEAIVTSLFKQIFPNILAITRTDMPIEERLKHFIDTYIAILLKNPFLPAFVIQEMNRDAHFFGNIFKSIGINTYPIFTMFEQEMEAGNIRKMDPRDVMLNILSMCLFPFASRPLMQLIMFDNNTESYMEYLEQRKASVTEFVLNAILIQ